MVYRHNIAYEFLISLNRMLRKIRITLAAAAFILCTLIFLDFTGALSTWAGWMARIQFLPAVLAANVAVILLLVIITLVFGRIYCSVICPLGVYQDIVSHISGRRKKFRMRFHWSPEKKWLRYGVLVLFIIALIAGVNAFVAFLAPYSTYGRFVQNLFSPLWLWGNNLLALAAEKAGGYAFAHKDVWIRSIPTFAVTAAMFVLITALAWRGGRTWCNAVCPVGTILSFFARFSALRPVIDTDKCKTCHLCEKKCKSSCIDLQAHKIDYSRCVDCFDCIDNCKSGAIHYKPFRKASSSAKTSSADDAGNSPAASRAALDAENSPADAGRRAFITSSVIAAGALTLKAQEKKVDGGYAAVTGKKVPERTRPIVPPGAESGKNFYSHCTGCQLCVSQCPNNVLRPSTSPEHLMQPEMSYERGWCRVECTKCSQVCPAGAIIPVTPEEKTSIHIGVASVDLDLCVVNRDGVSCGNCARHCPAGAIMMVRKDPSDGHSLRIPAVDESRCIGCGACEYLCPSRPFSAIKVDGLAVHRKD